MDQATCLVTAAADRGYPLIGLQVKSQRLGIQILVVGDGEPFPEQAERYSIHGNGGIRKQTFVVNISLLGFTAISLYGYSPRLASLSRQSAKNLFKPFRYGIAVSLQYLTDFLIVWP